MFKRILATLCALVVYAAVTRLYQPVATLKAGDAAAGQFQNSDQGALTTPWLSGTLTGAGGRR